MAIRKTKRTPEDGVRTRKDGSITPAQRAKCRGRDGDLTEYGEKIERAKEEITEKNAMIAIYRAQFEATGRINFRAAARTRAAQMKAEEARSCRRLLTFAC